MSCYVILCMYVYVIYMSNIHVQNFRQVGDGTTPGTKY